MNIINNIILISVLSVLLIGCDSPSTTASPISSPEATGERPDKPTATVVDKIAPVITLNGKGKLTIYQNDSYKDAGARAIDNKDGDISNKLIIKNSVNTAETGEYIVTYDVTDAAGNQAIQQKRVVNVVKVPNIAPDISGTPKTQARIYDIYQFQPVAHDANGDTLSFSISNKPDWASFDKKTGRLTGIPTAKQNTSDIRITVSDGEKVTTLPSFDITVTDAVDIAHKFGVATQGTDNSYYYFSPAALAIDDDDTTYNHTQGGAEGKNWLQIKLPDATKVRQIIIQSRKTQTYRLQGAKVYLSQKPYTGTVNENELLTELKGSAEEQIINLENPKSGTYLIIKGKTSASDNRHIHLIKVEVYGTTPEAPGANAQKQKYLVKSGSPTGTVVGTLAVIDYQNDPLSYRINSNEPFIINANGELIINDTLDKLNYEFDVSVSDGVNEVSTHVTVNVTAEDAIEQLLKSGDVIKTVVTEEELIQATLDEIEKNQSYFIKAKAQIFNLNADGSARADGSSLTDITWNPTHDASLFKSTLGDNIALLYTNGVNDSTKPVRKKEIAIIGKQEKGRYAIFGANPLRVEGNKQMNQVMENTLAWLTGRTNLKSAPFSVVIAHLGDSYYFRDETKTREWLDRHYTNQVSYKKADVCDGAALAACLETKPDLLIISQVSSKNDDVDAIANTVKNAMQKGLPVLYIHHDGDYKALAKSLFEKVFDVQYHWDNYHPKLTLQNYNPSEFKDDLVQVKTLFTHIKNKDFAFDWSLCENSKGEKDENAENCTKVAGLNSEFKNGAMAVKNMLDYLDRKRKNIFLTNDYRLQKLLILTADKLRQSISYPMDKASTDDNTFMRAYYTDHAVYNYRKINPAQPDLGNFSRSDFSHITPVTKTVNITSKRYFRSAGVYALPGQTVTVKRNDHSDLTVKVFINTLRSGSTHQYQYNGYSRPKYLQTPHIEIKPGEQIALTSPYGGTLQLEFSDNDLPVSITFENVGEHAYWASPADNDSFTEKLAKNEFDWAEIATAGFEVHSKLDKMIESVANPKWGGTADGLANAVNKYTSNYPHVLAGFKGEGIDVVPEIHDWAKDKGLTIETIDIIKHMNADQASCGTGCSGNPYDAYWAFNPIGHGDIHEMGHSMQKMRFEGFPNHAATNTFSFYTKSRYTANTGDTNNACWNGMPFKTLYETIQSAVGQANRQAFLKTNLWDKAGLGEQYLLKIEAMMHAQKMGKVENGWHVLARVHILEREMWRAKKDWDTRKASVGFDQYSLEEINNIRNNDWLIIAYSYAAELDYTNYFDMMGIPYSEKARTQIKSFGFDVVPNALFKSEGLAYCSSVNLLNQPLINVDGTTVWDDE